MKDNCSRKYEYNIKMKVLNNIVDQISSRYF